MENTPQPSQCREKSLRNDDPRPCQHFFPRLASSIHPSIHPCHAFPALYLRSRQQHHSQDRPSRERIPQSPCLVSTCRNTHELRGSERAIPRLSVVPESQESMNPYATRKLFGSEVPAQAQPFPQATPLLSCSALRGRAASLKKANHGSKFDFVAGDASCCVVDDTACIHCKL